MTETNPDPDDPLPLAELPPSAKLAYVVIDYEGLVLSGALPELTHLSSRTCRYALDRLMENGHICRERYARDARQWVYYTPDHPRATADNSLVTGADAVREEITGADVDLGGEADV